MAGRMAREERGSSTVFALFVFLVMLMVGGFAIDIMRQERERARLQATLDRAVLAAADIEQRLEPSDVVRSWFDAAGMSDALVGAPEVEDAFLTRSVGATASREMRAVFLHMLGVDTLAATTSARAQEEQSDIEISLILDVSSSMRSYGRGTTMKAAATEFVEMMLARAEGSSDGGITTISLVPYSMTVNLDAQTLALYDLSGTHDYSHCVLFDDPEFRGTGLEPSAQRRQYPHFDHGDAGYVTEGGRRVVQLPLCPPGGINRMLPFSSDAGTLSTAIADLVFWGATGIDAGLRWGVALLDPSTRGTIDALVGAGALAPEMAGRPRDFAGDSDSVLKVVVMMTDGDPDAQRDLRAPLRDGPSNVWYDTRTGRYSVLLRGTANFPWDRANRLPQSASCNAYWNRHTRDAAAGHWIRRVGDHRQDDDCKPVWYWVDEDKLTQDYKESKKGRFEDHPQSIHVGRAENDADGDGVADRYDWDALAWSPTDGGLIRLGQREVFNRFTAWDHVEFLYRHPQREGWISNAEWGVYGSPWFETNDKDGAIRRSHDLCEAAKAKGIVIYTIGFEMDRIKEPHREKARRLMNDCASSPAEYFDVDSVGLAEAFGVIATRIGGLRLVR